MNPYEAKKQARIKRLSERATAAEQEAQQLSHEANQMASVIPLGQPILVGHHSEGRDRRYRDRIRRKYAAAAEAFQKAKYYRERAAAAESHHAIASDDPEAVQKLREKVNDLRAWLDSMKSINATLRKAKLTLDTPDLENKLSEAGLDEDSIKHLLHACRHSWNRKLGYPSYAITNLSANIRRIEQRIEPLEKARTETTEEKVIHGVRLVNNVEENRVQIFFPGKPDEALRTYLKQTGFRWTPSQGCWQRHRSPAAWDFAERAAAAYPHEADHGGPPPNVP